MSDADFLFGPAPYEEAVAFLKNKPAVARRVFDRLLPEIKGRVFTITGVESANVLQSVRDAIAELPAGARWDDVKGRIADELSLSHPFVPGPDADEEEAAAAREAAERRAEILMRTHGFMVYEAGNHRAIVENAEVFPYSMYMTAKDDRVRDSHRALDGVVLPTLDPFWDSHTGPWDWGCRCTKAGLPESAVNKIRDRDADGPPEARQIIEGAAKKKLDENGSLFRSVDGAPARNYDVRAPIERATTAEERRAAFSWNPGDLRLPLDGLRARYDAPVWEAFENFARAQALDGKGTTVWEWLGGSPVLPAGSPPVAPKEAPDSIESALARLGLNKKVQWNEKDVRALIAEMKESSPARAADLVASISGEATRGKFSAKSIMATVQEVVDFLPPSIATGLPKFKIQLAQSLGGGVLGSYSDATHTLKISKSAHGKGGPDLLRETIYHELTHWIHMHGPQSYRDAIKSLYDLRTAGEPLVGVGYTNPVRKDKWWWNYAGTQYLNRGETDKTVAGLEVPTTHVELLAKPARLANLINVKPDALIIENLRVILGVFFNA